MLLRHALALLAVFPLAAGAQPTPTPLFAFDSPTPADGGGFGIAVEAVGDLDGDGVPDVVVSAPDEDALVDGAALEDVGALHAFSGATGAFLRTYVSPDPETNAYFADALLAAGDQDGDGVGDFYASASREFVGDLSDAGRVYLLSGADGAAIRSFTAPTPGLDAEFGFSLDRLGDLTGDGVGEIGVGAHLERVGGLAQAGRLYVFDGATEALVFALQAPQPQEQGVFGYTSADAGDVDGDGVPDVVTGEPGRDIGPLQLVGRAYLFSGATGELLRTIDSPNPTQAGGFGRWVAGLGDTDGDGVPDVATGSDGEQPGGLFYGGRAYVLSGADGSALQTFVSPDLQTFGFFGELVEAVGDLDGDGRTDLAVSARAEDDAGIDQVLAGRVYLFSSATGALLGTLAPPAEDPDGVQYFGYGLANLGDLDGDGRAEVGVGAFSEQPAGVAPDGRANFGGRAHVFSGALATPAEAAPGGAPLALAVAPNPAAGRAELRATLATAGPVRLDIVDALGRTVATLVEGERPAGELRATLDAGALTPGVHLARLRAGGATQTVVLTIAR